MPSAHRRRYRGRFRYIPRIRGRHAIYFRPNRYRLRRRRRQQTAASFKRRQVYTTRRLVRHRAILRTKRSGFVMKQFKRDTVLTLNAKTMATTSGSNSVQNVYLTINDVILPDDLDFIKKNYDYWQPQSLVIRIQLQEIQRPFQYSPQNVGSINTGTVNIGGSYTPRLYIGLFALGDLVPLAPTSTSDQDIQAIKGEWINHPKCKTLQSNKIMTFYWNLPKPDRSHKHETNTITGSDNLSTCIIGQANQLPHYLKIFWADLNKYYYTLTATNDNTALVLNMQYTLLVKLTDNTAWKTAQL